MSEPAPPRGEPEPIRSILPRVLERIQARERATLRRIVEVFPGVCLYDEEAGCWRRLVCRPALTTDQEARG